MSGSLGFNPMRQPRMTNLPGAVGASVVVATPRRRRSPSARTPKPDLPAPAPRPIPTVVPPTAPHDKLPSRQDDIHTAYATVDGTLCEAETGREIATEGARVCVTYPMKPGSGEKVLMRIKSIDPGTAQMSYRWAVVYDPATDTHSLGEFSLFP